MASQPRKGKPSIWPSRFILTFLLDLAECAGCGHEDMLPDVRWLLNHLGADKNVSLAEFCRSIQVVDATPVQENRSRAASPSLGTSSSFGKYIMWWCTFLTSKLTTLQRHWHIHRWPIRGPFASASRSSTCSRLPTLRVQASGLGIF